MLPPTASELTLWCLGQLVVQPVKEVMILQPRMPYQRKKRE